MIDQLDFSKLGGLLPAIVQEEATGSLLMVGFMNREAVELTIETGRVTFYSRSRARLWQKGESSGNHLEAVSVHPDCDGDTLLVVARPTGPVCHTGSHSCFATAPRVAEESTVERLERTVRERRRSMPEGSYTTELFGSGRERIAQKVGEEGVELVIAALGDDRARIVAEAADLLYHVIVLLVDAGLSLADVQNVLRSRMLSTTELPVYCASAGA